MGTELYEKAKETTRGVIAGTIEVVLVAVILLIVLGLTRNIFSLGIDDTDLNGWKRSGMILYTDYKTGIEYLSTPKGGLIRRAEK